MIVANDAGLTPVGRSEPHWYLFNIGECPVCGHVEEDRQRIPGQRPDDPGERYKHYTRYDWCDV